MKPCNALSTHYSAFIDGELTALESVAIRKHLLRCPECRKEVQELENMKLSVHLHGFNSPKRPGLKNRLEKTLNNLERTRKQRIQASLLAAATALGIIVVIGSTTPSASVPETSIDSNQTPLTTSLIAPISKPVEVPLENRTLNDKLVDDLVKRHLGIKSPLSVNPRGILSFEALPARFLEGGSHVRQVLNASYQRCLQTRPGASLAVLDASTLKLPAQVEASLDRIGVYVEQRDNVEIRISQSGQRFFVLLTDKSHRLESTI